MKENVCFLNCFLLYPEFLFRNGQTYRIPKILPFLKKNKPSIIGLAEVFRGFCSQMKSEAMKHGYEFVYYNDGYIQNSGLMFLYNPDKWSCLQHTKDTFVHYTGSDRLANKGFMLLKMLYKKNGKVVYFLLTHLNANQYSSQKTENVQIKQLQQIKNFLLKHGIHNHSLVLMGDFNIDYNRSFLKNELDTLGHTGSPYEFTTNLWSKEGYQVLDYIILHNVDGNTKTEVLRYKNNLLSDHNPILRKINL